MLSTPNEQYVGIVDGSGVIGDPNGLNKDELKRLAKERKMINNFDKSLLSKDGFIVLVDDKDVQLPNGEVINNGVYFRNLFHLNLKKYFGHVDLFVPCGGRPAAIDIDNINNLIDENGKSVISYIVEGANLFITQNAKIEFEKAGAVVFKDASTNKGGVTSSSLEVLASLVLNDEQFLSKFKNGTDFYREYVQQVQKTIVSNAEKEAASLLKYKAKTGLSLPEASDSLSNEINKLSDLIAQSDDLWNDLNLRKTIFTQSIPSLLLQEAGSVDEVLKRLPDAYSRSLFATAISTRYIYEDHDPQNVIELLQFLKKLGSSA